MSINFDQRYIDFNLARDYPPAPPEEQPDEMPMMEDVQLAAGPSGTVSDAGAAFGVFPQMKPRRGGRSDIGERVITGAPDFAAGAARGATTAALGIGGDIQKIGRFITALATDNQGGSITDRLGRAAQTMENPTLLPSSEDVSKGGYTIPGTSITLPGLPPAVPAGQAGFGMTPEQRQSAAEAGQFAGELVGDPLILSKGAKAVGQGAMAVGRMAGQELDRAILEGTGPLASVVPQSARPLFAVEPGKFNPKTELPKAVEAVAADPNLSVYLPQAERAPSVALRLSKPEIQGTGEKGALTVGDIGVVLEKSQLAMNKGKPLDPTKPKDLVKMVDSATAEAEYQMSQPISGATWYEDDVAQAFALGSKIVPELATDEPLRVLTTAFAASTSYNKRAGENWSVAMRITEDFMKTNKVASRNPDNGKLWGGTTGPIMEQQLNLHQYMINRMGMDGYAEWLLTPHTVKEISDMKAASGLYKTPGIPGKATDMKMGSFILGEKGGAFFLNLNGIKETTADKWFTRTYNRHTGTLTSGPVSEQGLVDSPRNESERSIMKTWNRSVAQNMGLDEQANQAVLWYYEQSLYYNLGIKSARSESFSDGAKNLLNARGIAFTDAELAGARGRSNATKAGAESQGAAGAGNPVGLGEAAPDAAATATSVTGGRSAPKKGAK
jgi:hypothetical protein